MSTNLVRCNPFLHVNVCVQEVMKETVSYPMSVLRGLVTEGSILLLMRLIALRKKLPEHMTFISLDQGLHITHTSFVSSYVCVRLLG